MTVIQKYLFHPVVTAISLLLLCVVLLRIPSFTEPYWYGDEGIYLIIGTAMNNGAVLYKDIVDHKTPLIYYFARVGSQLNFRILLTAWMAMASVAFFAILLRLTKKNWLSAFFTFVFIVATSVPLLEGNIPNGELFVMGFVLVGIWLYTQSSTGLQLLKGSEAVDQITASPSPRVFFMWLLAGVCMGGAILTKVPALFDAASLFFIGWLASWDLQLAKGWHIHSKAWLRMVQQWGVLGIGVALPLLGSVVYFSAIGAGKEYLEFGLLYNFHYVQNWTLGHLPAWGQFAFTLPVKAAILIVVLIKITLLSRWISRPVRWATGWFFLALFAGILSNRPYPHYILQVLPPLVLTLGLVAHEITHKRKKSLTAFARLATLGAAFSCLVAVYVVWTSLRISHYPVLSYYQNYFRFISGQLDPIVYRNSFNSYMPDNYSASQVLKASSDSSVFIWGTNPMLYALSGKQPVGRFTVAFHIQDLQLYDETLAAVRASSPEYIVVMKDEHIPLPGLESFLRGRYFPSRNYEHFTIWRRMQK